VLSIAALDRHPRIRGTAASAQAFMQMLLSTVSAGIVVPFVWFSPLGLAWAMAVYLVLGWVLVRKTQLWEPKANTAVEH
jgi:DHA1 family bicyclomycin/chloramphenicol resistance-like MFS transporter